MMNVDDYIVSRTLHTVATDHPKNISILQRVGVWEDGDSATTNTRLDPLENVVLFHDGTARKKSNKQQQQQETDEKVSTPATNRKKSITRRDPITSDEIFDIIRNIQDPEHPLTLEQLGVVSRNQISIQDIYCNDESNNTSGSRVFSTCHVRFTPTIPHCSMATLIGLCIRVKLLRSLPIRFKVVVTIEPGTHNTEQAINKQLADKERVCAALDNKHLLGVVNKCIQQGMMMSSSS